MHIAWRWKMSISGPDPFQRESSHRRRSWPNGGPRGQRYWKASKFISTAASAASIHAAELGHSSPYNEVFVAMQMKHRRPLEVHRNYISTSLRNSLWIWKLSLMCNFLREIYIYRQRKKVGQDVQERSNGRELEMGLCKMLTLSWAFECLNYGLREVIDVERVNSLNGRAHDHKIMKPGHCHGNGQIQN